MFALCICESVSLLCLLACLFCLTVFAQWFDVCVFALALA